MLPFRSLLLLLLVANPLFAETVTLDQALREAVAARPFVQAARQDAAAAEAAVGEARSRYLPRATLSETFVWTDEPATAMFISLNQEDLEVRPDADFYNNPPDRRDFETRLTIEQPLYNPDIAYGRRRAEAGAGAAEAGARWSAEQASFAAFRAYLAVQQAEGALDWVRTAQQEAEEILRLAVARREAGLGLKADELRARVLVSAAKRRTLSAENDLTLARRRLALAMGREGGEVAIAGPVDAGRLAPATEAAVPRADLEAVSMQVRQSTLAREQSQAAWLPRLGIAGSYTLHDDSSPVGSADSWLLRAGLTWELFDGGARRHAVARSAATEKAAEARLREAVREANLATEEADLRAAEAQLQAATADASLAEAEESFRLIRERFDAGLTDLSELLATQAALDRVRFDRLQAHDRYLLALGNRHFQRGNFMQALLPAAMEEIP